LLTVARLHRFSSPVFVLVGWLPYVLPLSNAALFDKVQKLHPGWYVAQSFSWLLPFFCELSFLYLFRELICVPVLLDGILLSDPQRRVRSFDPDEANPEMAEPMEELDRLDLLKQFVGGFALSLLMPSLICPWKTITKVFSFQVCG
jgi:hypothetical protein